MFVLRLRVVLRALVRHNSICGVFSRQSLSHLSHLVRRHRIVLTLRRFTVFISKDLRNCQLIVRLRRFVLCHHRHTFRLRVNMGILYFHLFRVITI